MTLTDRISQLSGFICYADDRKKVRSKCQG